MATPLTADRILTALRAEGIHVVEDPGWRTHNRNKAGAWGPINGIMIHHTVTSPTQNGVTICRTGYSQLPGPLCHGVIRRDGTVHLIGNGRANHAGGGDPRVLAAVTAENYGTRPPSPREHQGSPGAVDGNARFYGFECENLGDGEDPWPAAQVDAIVRVAAALTRAHGWGAKSVIGHSEWSDWKNDPRGPGMPSMPTLRTRIDARLKDSTTPAPKPPTEDTMPTPRENWGYRNSEADAKNVAAGRGHIPDAYAYLVTTHDLVAALTRAVAELRTEVLALRREIGQ